MGQPGAPCRRGRTRRSGLIPVSIGIVITGSFVAPAGGAAGAGAVPGNSVTVERVSGPTVDGELLRIDERAVHVDVAGRPESLPIETVRRLVRRPAPGTDDGAAGAVGVVLVDGSRLEGDRFVWSGETALVARGEEQASLPADLVRMAAWPAPAAGMDPPWLALLPEPADSDVVVVGAGTSFECVACALAGVEADAVTVVLDGETIPVRREKVAGLRWLRDDAPAGGVAVTVAGGTVRGVTITWSPDALVIDGAVRLPATWLRAIDYASGRSVSLTGLTPERVETEPFFAGLASVEGLATFFAPRAISRANTDGAPAGLVVRPRTRVAWRIPQDARRFRATVVPAAQASGDSFRDGGVVAITVDGREVVRESLTPATEHAAHALPARSIDIDVTAAKRLEILVDFPDAGGMGGPVLLRSPAFEK